MNLQNLCPQLTNAVHWRKVRFAMSQLFLNCKAMSPRKDSIIQRKQMRGLISSVSDLMAEPSRFSKAYSDAHSCQQSDHVVHIAVLCQNDKSIP